MTITKWGGKCGVTVKSGRLHLEVWDHGGVTRCVHDESLCGYRGTHHTKVEKGKFEEMAQRAVDKWKNNRTAWEPCEP